MKKGILLASIILLVQFSFGQNFNNIYTTQNSTVFPPTDPMLMSNVVNLDGSSATIFRNSRVMKVDDNGVEVWNNIYDLPGPVPATLHSICKTDDDNYLVVGNKLDAAYVVKINQDGTVAWSKTYRPYNGGIIVRNVIRTNEPQEEYIITGMRPGVNNNSNKIAAFKIDDNGNLFWTYEYSDNSVTTNFYRPSFVTGDITSAAIVMVGSEISTVGSVVNNSFAFGIDVTGGISKQYTSFDLGSGEFAPSISQGADNDGYAIASRISGLNLQPGISTMTSLLKVDEFLTPQWARVYATDTDSENYSVSLHYDPHGNYDIAMTVRDQSAPQSFSAFMKVDDYGIPISNWRYDIDITQWSISMAQNFTNQSEDYILQSLYLDSGVLRVGLTQLDLYGKSECAHEVQTNVYDLPTPFNQLMFSKSAIDLIVEDIDTEPMDDPISSYVCQDANQLIAHDDMDFMDYESLDQKVEVDNSTSTYSENDNSIEKTITVHPNPTQNRITISTNFEKGYYKIFDVNGRLMNKGLLMSGETSFDLSDINSGIYFIQIISDKNQIYTERILKN